ncbi:cyclin-like protein [Sporodiniella umbellata]|nr:cyclin-like protein [Sporodiniella umbellata]
MAANYWTSTQQNCWMQDRWALAASREEDLKYLSETDYIKIRIWFCHLIQKLAKRLQLRQQVIATAIVYFKRFYINNSIRATDPLLVLVTCVYLATKIEECPVHIKMVTQEARHAFHAEFNGFPYDSFKVAEFEFYLLEELEFYLIIWHPYRTLTQIAHELGMRESGLQYAWFIINDSYRTDICLLYPPHLIALSAIYLTVVLNTPESTFIESKDMKQWFASLTIDINSIIEISQELLAVYDLWSDWKEEKAILLYKEFRNKPLS